MAEWRSSSHVSLRTQTSVLALAAIWISIAVATLIESIVLAVGPVEPAWVVTALPLLGVLYASAGLVAWWRRPGNRVGPILVTGGWFWLLAGLINTDVDLFIAIGQLTAILPFALIVHLVVVYPTGRASTFPARALVIIAYVTATIFQVPRFLLEPSADLASPLQIVDWPAVADVAIWVQRSLGLAIVVATAMLVWHGLRSRSPSTRRVVAPVAGYGLFAVLVVPISGSIVEPLLGIHPLTRAMWQIGVLGLVPLAFAIGVMIGGFARTGDLVELGAWLGADHERASIELVLAQTLGDPSVQVLFWLADDVRYVDAHGRAVDLPNPDTSARRHEPIEFDGRHLGAIVYDASTIEDAAIVAMAGRVAAIAIDRQRLILELLASRDALRESRTRIIDAGDRERRRIARDLHDGLQARLVLLAIWSQQLIDESNGNPPDAVGQLRAGLQTAIDELRELVHGVMPALLYERGLTAATQELAGRMPVPTEVDASPNIARLPMSVESAAYFVVLEGVTNAMKHSCARRVRIRLHIVDGELHVEVIDDGVGGAVIVGGTGLRGVHDRVDALGGRLVLDSAPGHGTSVRAAVPCAL